MSLISKDEVINWLLYSWGELNPPMSSGDAEWGWTHQADDFEKVTKIIITDVTQNWMIDGVKYSAFDMLEHFPNLEELQLYFSRTFKQIKPVPKLKEIKTLTLYGEFDFIEMLEQPEWEIFSGLTQIKFSSYHLTRLPDWIYQHPSIESLEINSCASLKPDLAKLAQAHNIQELILSNHIRNIYKPKDFSDEINDIKEMHLLASGVDELSWLEAACILPNLRKFASYNLNFLDVPMPLLTSEKLEELIIFLKDTQHILPNNQQDRQRYIQNRLDFPQPNSNSSKTRTPIAPLESLDKSTFEYSGFTQTPERSAAANIACRTLPLLAQSHSILPNLKTLAYVGEIEPQAWEFLIKLPKLTHLSLATKSNLNQLLTEQTQLSSNLQSLKIVDLREHNLDTLELRKQLHASEHANWMLEQFNQQRKSVSEKSTNTNSQLSNELSWVVNFNWLSPLTNLENLELLIHTSHYPPQIGELTKLKRLVLRLENFKGGFPESWSHLSRLESLEVLDFGQVGENFEVFKETPLKSLVLNTGVSSELSRSVGKLSQLEKLVIFGGRLLSLPQSLGDLSKLKELQLFNTKLLTSLPERLTLLSQLEKLEIISSGLKHLPDNFKGFKNLREFRLEDTPIEELPLTFGNNPNLEKITFNQLYSLINAYFDPQLLTNLKELNFANTVIFSHEMFREFPNLMVVKLENLLSADLKSLSESEDWKETISSWKVLGVAIDSFTPQANHKWISELLLQEYKLIHQKKPPTKGTKPTSKLPQGGLGPRLGITPYFFDDRPTVDLTSSSQSLRFISANNIFLTSIKDNFEKLENLSYLSLNNMTYLQRIPDEIENLKNLRFLKIHGAINLEEISANIGKLHKLQNLDICYRSSSPLSLDFIADLTSLTDLFLGVRNFKDFSRDWTNLKNLEHLNICNLVSKQLPEQICDLGNLRFLSLFEAPNLSKLPENFNRLSQLKELRILTSPQISLSGLDFTGLNNLAELSLGDLSSISLPVGIDSLPNLEEVNLVNLPKLIQFTGGNISLPRLKKMRIYACKSLKSLGQNWLSTPNPQAELIISDCHRLLKLPSFGGKGCANNANSLNSSNWGLKRIFVDNCNSLEEFPQLSAEASDAWEQTQQAQQNQQTHSSTDARYYYPGVFLGFRKESGVSLEILGENKISTLPHPKLLKGVTSLACNYLTYENRIKSWGTAPDQVYDEVTDLAIDYLGKSTKFNAVVAPVSFTNLQNLKILDLNPKDFVPIFHARHLAQQVLSHLKTLEIYFSHNLQNSSTLKPMDLDFSELEELESLQSLGLYNFGNRELGFNLSNTQIKNLTLANCPYLGAEMHQAILDHGLEKLYLLKVNPEVYDERLYHPDSISVNGQKQSNTLQNRVGMIISCTEPNDQRVWFLQHRRPVFSDNLYNFFTSENLLSEAFYAFQNLFHLDILRHYYHEQYGIVNLQPWNRNHH